MALWQVRRAPSDEDVLEGTKSDHDEEEEEEDDDDEEEGADLGGGADGQKQAGMAARELAFLFTPEGLREVSPMAARGQSTMGLGRGKRGRMCPTYSGDGDLE